MDNTNETCNCGDDYESCGCGDDCGMLNMNKDEPCYGKVNVVREEEFGDDWERNWVWIHVCEGHADSYDYGKYKPKSTNE